ncbi:MAG: hypothetical protein IPM48_14945 [Saprospiraceae bacterium]|nr:hypothetical protein [Saprospiraceae bacterium]
MAKNKTKTYNFTRNQFFGLLLGAIISTSIATVAGTVRILNSDHFTIIALGNRLENIENAFVPRGEIDLKFEILNNKIDANTKLLESINNKL